MLCQYDNMSGNFKISRLYHNMMRTIKGLAKGIFLKIKHNYGSKIYHKNHKIQVSLYCYYVKHKCF